MAIPFLQHIDLKGNIDLNKNELQNARIQNLGTAPGSPVTGQIYYDNTSGDDKMYYWNDSVWVSMSGDIDRVDITAGDGLSGTSVNTTTGTHTQTLTVGQGTGISVTTNAVAVAAAQTTITSIYATDLIMGEDAQTAIDFGTANEIDFKADNAVRLTLTASALYPVTTNQIDLGTSSLEFKNAWFDGTVTADAFAGPLTGSLTIGGHMVDDIDITSEASNADDHLMTALAIKNRIEDYSYITASSTDTLSNKTIAASQVTEISNLSAVEGAQLENIDSVTISNAQWAFLGAATGAITNVNDDVSIPNLKTALAGGFASNAVQIGDSSDTVTIAGNLVVSGDTITANVGTLDVEDKNITLNYSSGDSSSTASGSGITIQDAVDASTNATILWDTTNDEFDFSHAINITGNITVSGSVDGIADLAGAVNANTAKNTNVSTNLDITGTNAARVITSSDGTNATIPVATTSVSGVMSAAQVTTLNATQTAANVGTLIDARSVVATIDSSAMAATSDMKAEIRHNLGTEDVTVTLFEKTSKTTVYAEIKREEYGGTDSGNYITIYFSAEPSEDIEVIISSHDGATAAAAVAYA